MKIGVEINGVLRNTIEKFSQIYEKSLVTPQDDELQLKSFELSLDEGSEDEITNDNFKYEIISDVTSLNLMDHFSFKSKDEFFKFMYEEHPMEIFGHAPSSEMFTFNELNDFYLEFRDNHEITIISDEIGKSKPATLFFLSKFGCLTESVIFYNEITKDQVLSKFDLIVTSNPDIIINYENVIKYETMYNQNIDSKETITSIKELKLKINNDKNL
jgi:hypothetical protein